MKTKWVYLALMCPIWGNAEISLEEAVSVSWENGLYLEANQMLSECEGPVCLRLTGIAELNGYGRDPSPAKGMRLLRKATELGDVDAHLSIAEAYADGLGVQMSKALAFTHYTKAAESNPTAAARYAEIALANKMSEQPYDPIERLRFAAESGEKRAMWILGDQLKATNPIHAVEWFKKAKNEIPPAYGSLGELLHSQGKYEEALMAFVAGHAANDPLSSAYAGFYAENGLARQISKREAFEYYAAAEGISWASQGMDRIRANADSVQLQGVRIHSATRREIRSKLAAASLEVVTDGLFDNYALSQSGGQATIAYLPAPPNYPAEVVYIYRDEDRGEHRKRAKQLFEKLEQKYGDNVLDSKSDGRRHAAWDQTHHQTHLETDPKQRLVVLSHRLKPYWGSLKEHLESNKQRKENEIDEIL